VNGETKIYYSLKPLIPRWLQILVRRAIVQRGLVRYAHVWPIDPNANTVPPHWKGWPGNKQFAFVLTHDVEMAKGQEKAEQLAEMERSMGFRSSFNFVPKRYAVEARLREYLVRNGFEVGVHGLYHDGKYYTSREVFSGRALEINNYLREWKAVGFRSPSMLHNLAWIHDLNIEYDASTFDTDPFEPQADGVGSIFPFWVSSDNGNGKGYVELPYPLPQDFTLFVLMNQKSPEIWKKKIDWIAENGGMALLNTHPDYMNFDSRPPALEEYPMEYYAEFLDYVQTEYSDSYWPALPKEMALFWRTYLRDVTYGDDLPLLSGTMSGHGTNDR
jgi:hypothetical protein